MEGASRQHKSLFVLAFGLCAGLSVSISFPTYRAAYASESVALCVPLWGMNTVRAVFSSVL